jgi:tripartite-type tricarboxylate transporter receptor subunit TctC
MRNLAWSGLRHVLARAVAALFLVHVCAAVSNAQDWPAKPVRIVSPFAPGGSSDTMGRILAERLSERFGQQFFIENRGGAGGLIGTAAVASAPADGYTFIISSIGTHVTSPAASANPGYHPIADFTHVAFAGGPPTVIVVHPSLGVRSFAELRALLKNSAGTPYVSPGPGTVGNLIAEFWAERDNFKLAHVAYKGSGQAMNDLVAGHVKMGSLTWTAARGQMRGGTILPLAVSSAQRMPEFPDVPTLKELGYPDLVVTTWFGIAAPTGLPYNILERMNVEVGVALESDGVRDRLVAEGFELARMSPTEMTGFVQAEIGKWGALTRRAAGRETNR